MIAISFHFFTSSLNILLGGIFIKKLTVSKDVTLENTIFHLKSDLLNINIVSSLTSDVDKRKDEKCYLLYEQELLLFYLYELIKTKLFNIVEIYSVGEILVDEQKIRYEWVDLKECEYQPSESVKYYLKQYLKENNNNIVFMSFGEFLSKI